MNMSVLVPTFRRPRDLERCLGALARQTRRAGEIIVVARPEDDGSRAVLEGAIARVLPLKAVMVHAPGQVAALNAGLEAARGDIIAITDDDAAPHPDWLERIAATFASDSRIGGVGGRDIVHGADGVPIRAPIRRQVGRLQWQGRVIGNHHIGAGPPRAVDALKGANMSYRRTAIGGLRFDMRLRGTGAQVHNDLAFALAIKRAGWKLIYDPSILVDHFPAARFDADARGAFNAAALSDASYNEALILMEHLTGARRGAYLIWSELIGSRASPGLLQWVRLRLAGDALGAAKWRAAAKGRADARKARGDVAPAAALNKTLEAH